MLLVPIAYAAGMVPLESTLRPLEIRKNLMRVVRGATSTDAVNVYRAVKYASPGGIGKAIELDVNDANSIARIRKQNLSFCEHFLVWDMR